MPPKAAAEKKPAAKAPAKAPAEKKEAGKKTAATGDKKKRTKTRKETYSSYIYKGAMRFLFQVASHPKHWARPHHSDMTLNRFQLRPSSLSLVLNFQYSLTLLILVLKQVHPDTGISNRAMSILNSFVNGMAIQSRFHLLITNASSRYLWACCHRGLQACRIQQEINNLIPRDSNLVSCYMQCPF